VVARESLPSSSEDYYPRNETTMSRMQPVQSSLSWITCQIAENEEKLFIFKKQITHLSTHGIQVAV
jgi:hypothetical protein